MLARLVFVIRFLVDGLVHLRGVLAAGVAFLATLPGLAVSLLPSLLPAAGGVARIAYVAVRTVLVMPRYLLAATILLPATFVAISAVTNPYMREVLAYAHERSSAIELVDAKGRWLGIIPPANFDDWSDGAILPADHEALPTPAIPPVWRTCIVHLEDREFDGMSRLFGIDPVAVLKSGWQTLTGDRRRGASTLYMQVVRTLRGQSPDQNETVGEVALRKIAELLGANALVTMLATRDAQAAERFVAMHLPLAIGSSGSGFGQPVHGIGLASRLLFEARPEDLPPEAQAVLAAAVKAPVLLAPPSDRRGRALAEARWKRLKERADYCLRTTLKGIGDDVARARAALAAMPLPVPRIHPDLQPFLPRDERTSWQITVSPTRRALFFARNELAVLKQELSGLAGPEWRGHVLSIQLSTDATENNTFTADIAKELARLERTLPGLALSLTGQRHGAPRAHVVLACADADGKLRRIYSSHEDLLWTRKAPVGSLAKIVAAIALGRRDEPTTGYCKAPIAGLPSTSGDGRSCASNSSWIAARQAFARSSNEAIHWALRHHANKATLAEIAAILRLPPFGDVPPATALTIGTFELTPAQLLQLAAAVGAGLSDWQRDIPLASVLLQFTTIDETGRVHVHDVKPADALPIEQVRRLFTRRVRSFVATVLRATSDDGGTLQSLKLIRERLGGHLYAKTGTVSVLGLTQALHIAGTFIDAIEPRSFLASATAPGYRQPLGYHLVAARLASLARTTICAPRIPGRSGLPVTH